MVSTDLSITSLNNQLSRQICYLQGIISFGSFSGQHDTICAIEDGVGHVGGFSSGWPRLIDHRLEHLGGADHAFRGLVALRDDLERN
jgi:hypothetical protein